MCKVKIYRIGQFTPVCELTSVSQLVPYDGAVMVRTTDGAGICRIVQTPSVLVAASHPTGIAFQVCNVKRHLQYCLQVCVMQKAKLYR
jgi:hypothetical protein